MSNKSPRKIRSSQRQQLRMRFLIAAGVSCLALGLGFLIYLQLSEPESSKAEIQTPVSHENMPVDMNVETLLIQSPDTNQRNGMNYKVARPLSQTPQFSK